MLRKLLSTIDPGIRELENFQREMTGTWVVIFAGSFPDPATALDGYAQRVRAIDELLRPFGRIYVDTTGRSETPVRRLAHDTVLLSVGKSRFREDACARITAQAGSAYIHSLFGGSARLLKRVLATDAITRIWDVHGAVPEECAYRGADDLARKMEQLEAIAARSATHLVCVSEAMRQHLETKHGRLPGVFLQLPTTSAEPLTTAVPPNSLRFVYAGSTEGWQQFGPMTEAIARSPIDGAYTLFVPDPDAARPLLPSSITANARITIATDTPQGVRRQLPEFAYGFCLREDLALNRVACPTKIIDYIAAGVVPILSFTGMGDFEQLGLRSVALVDFVAGRLPGDAERLRMVDDNRTLLGELNQRYVANAARLVSAVTYANAIRDRIAVR